MLARLTFVSILMLAWAGGYAHGAPPDRFAIIIGNNEYERLPNGDPRPSSNFNLLTTQNDAIAYADTLAELGWTVINESLDNLTKGGMERMIFSAARQIGAGSEVLFVFNGHGFSDQGQNYLVGVAEDGEQFQTHDDMIAGSMPLMSVIERLAINEPARIIAVINACSDETLVQGVSQEPVRQSFDGSGVDEVLVLFSSSPRGIAYDVLDNFEREDPNSLSVFSRAFLPAIRDDRPLLSVFADVRIEVERMSRRAADAAGATGQRQLQIPHVLFDTINGRFSVANVANTSLNVAPGADWRIDPRACVLNEDYLAEALAARDTAPVRSIGTTNTDSVNACIAAAALSDLGIEGLNYAPEHNGVRVLQSSPGKRVENDDIISRLTFVEADGPQRYRNFGSIEEFREVLARHYFREETKLNLYIGKQENGGRDWDFNWDRE
ncbi:MAG: caspase family protein [Pseudomonadota bacterium]